MVYFENAFHYCENAATNANSNYARSRMEESSAGKHDYGGKGS
jgi:hypothetical protein